MRNTCAYPIQVTDQQAADQAYLVHHFNCATRIAAGRGDQYGQRCDVGAPLWMTYAGTTTEPLPPVEAHQ
jgi:hypothetical protein